MLLMFKEPFKGRVESDFYKNLKYFKIRKNTPFIFKLQNTTLDISITSAIWMKLQTPDNTREAKTNHRHANSPKIQT